MKENIRNLPEILFGSVLSDCFPERFQLILDAFMRENASGLRERAADPSYTESGSIHSDSPASRDSIKILSVEKLPDNEEKQNKIAEAEKQESLISCKKAEGEYIPNEHGISCFSAVTGNETDTDTIVSKFLAFHAVMLSAAGSPETFLYSFSGSENFPESFSASGKNSVNSDYCQYEKELSDSGSQKSRILSGYRKMLDAGKSEAAFNPEGSLIIPEASGPLFALLRISPDGKEKVLCLINISRRIIKCFAYWDFLSDYNKSKLYDIITEQESGALVIYHDSGKSDAGSGCSAMVTLGPWEVVWLK